MIKPFFNSEYYQSFNQTEPVTLERLEPLERGRVENEKNDFLTQPLIDELSHLNQRWQKALKLEQEGIFNGRNPQYREKVCQELRQMSQRATEIWEALQRESPKLLANLTFLESISLRIQVNGDSQYE